VLFFPTFFLFSVAAYFFEIFLQKTKKTLYKLLSFGYNNIR